jgi:hypothetical protein
MDSRVVTLDTGLFVCNGAIEDRGNLWPYGDVSTNFHSGVHPGTEAWDHAAWKGGDARGAVVQQCTGSKSHDLR